MVFDRQRRKSGGVTCGRPVNKTSRIGTGVFLPLDLFLGGRLESAAAVGPKVEVVKFDYLMPSRLAEIPALAAAVDEFLAAEVDLAFQVNLCLEELITNTITHGLNSDPERVVRVRIELAAGWLQVLVDDDAPPFDPFREAAPPDLDADIDERPIGGLGVYFVRRMMDEATASHDASGNHIVLRKRLPRSEGSTG